MLNIKFFGKRKGDLNDQDWNPKENQLILSRTTKSHKKAARQKIINNLRWEVKRLRKWFDRYFMSLEFFLINIDKIPSDWFQFPSRQLQHNLNNLRRHESEKKKNFQFAFGKSKTSSECAQSLCFALLMTCIQFKIGFCIVPISFPKIWTTLITRFRCFQPLPRRQFIYDILCFFPLRRLLLLRKLIYFRPLSLARRETKRDSEIR